MDPSSTHDGQYDILSLREAVQGLLPVCSVLNNTVVPRINDPLSNIIGHYKECFFQQHKIDPPSYMYVLC